MTSTTTAPANMNSVDAADFAPAYAATGFECGMEGYTEMVLNVVDLLIVAIPLIKEMTVAIMPEDLGKAIDHAYIGLTGANAWVGYLMAAVYYMALDQVFGGELCEASGVVATLITFLHGIVDWNQTNDRYTQQAANEAAYGDATVTTSNS